MKAMIAKKGYVFRNMVTGEILCEEVYMPDDCLKKDFEQITLEEAEKLKQKAEGENDVNSN